ncbi:hypothetical protein [Mesomycoplasma lagogenitalium]|uniref:Plectrovirus-related protein n=1 Tax=Mesomycoplasma lagogenitalium TaxID=171286 RepID=A0ABY8LUF9_9BACT|nr:hypothetical protein [Mesomycoplasma lagogenitalium]WGI36879.1 hypothetical protein QEG99_01170 [Mesomycoplasma lagogenitalium]
MKKTTGIFQWIATFFLVIYILTFVLGANINDKTKTVGWLVFLILWSVLLNGIGLTFLILFIINLIKVINFRNKNKENIQLLNLPENKLINAIFPIKYTFIKKEIAI